MAATIIDRLVVELGLDPKQFTSGQKAAAQSLLDLRKQAKSDGKAVEDATTAMAAGFSKVTLRVLELGTAYLGLRGLERHITAMTSQDVQLSRFAQTVGMTAQRISELEMATQRLGGTKAGADSSVQSVAGIVANFQQGKGLPPALQQLFARTGTKVDLSHLTTSSMMTAVATALQRESKVNPVLAASYASQLGLDPIFALMAEQHGSGLMGYAGSLGGLAPSQQALEATQKIVAAWMATRQQIDAILQHVIADAGPAVAQALGDLAKFLDQHGPELERILGQDIEQFVNALEGANWKEIGSEIDQVAKAADDVAKALGGWGPAIRDFAGAWLLLKGIGIIRGAGAATGGLLGDLVAPILAIMGADAAMKKYGKHMPHISNSAPDWISNSWFGEAARWLIGMKTSDVNASRAQGGMKPIGSSAGTALAKRQQQAMAFLTSQGVPAAAAAGWVANWQAESSLNPNARNGNHLGLVQWSPSRRTAISDALGPLALMSFDGQMRSSFWEMKTKYPELFAQIMSGKLTASQASDLIRNHYEIPDTPNSRNWGNVAAREDYAKSILGSYSRGAKFAAKASSPMSAPAGNVTISGPISIHTKATDAPGIARDFHASLENRVRAAKSNTGLQQ